MTHKKRTCALVIGHRKRSPGASNVLSGMSEFIFNQQLAFDIKERCSDVSINVVHRHTFRKLPDDINRLEPDFIISLHCNAYNKKASGTETLFYHRSDMGANYADILQHHIVMALGLRDRGIKPKGVEDRGGYLLKNTFAPCIISEPFFIDNDNDLKTAVKNRFGLIDAYINAISIMANRMDQHQGVA